MQLGQRPPLHIVPRHQFGPITSWWSGGNTTICHAPRRAWAGRTGTNLAHWLERQANHELQAHEQALLDGPHCVVCGKQKTPGSYVCPQCQEAEIIAETTDWEEVEREERLLRALPDGTTLTRSEFLEYLS